MAGPLDQRAPPCLGRVLACVESVDTYSRLRMAFAHQLNVTKADCESSAAFLVTVLSDEKISNSDIKGLLNRMLGNGWAVTSPYGANAKAARRHLEAAHQAITAWDGWIN